jgi:hypothetical protein
MWENSMGMKGAIVEKIDFEQKNTLAKCAIRKLCDYLAQTCNPNYFNAARAIRCLTRVQDFSTRENVRAYALDALTEVNEIIELSICRSDLLEKAESAIVKICTLYSED